MEQTQKALGAKAKKFKKPTSNSSKFSEIKSKNHKFNGRKRKRKQIVSPKQEREGESDRPSFSSQEEQEALKRNPPLVWKYPSPLNSPFDLSNSKIFNTTTQYIHP